MPSFSYINILAVFFALVFGHRDPLANVTWKTNIPEVDALVAKLTPGEKISLVHGSNNPGEQNPAGYIAPIPRLGIPAIQLTDGEAGVNIALNTTSPPSQLNVAASFSRGAAYNQGLIMGKESKLTNMTIALAPRVNILRDPVAGSSWQSYSEDPFLNAQLGVQAVHAIQSEGTMANTKQMGPASTGASAGDTNSIVDLQTLHEVYWAPHEALVAAGAATMMCSYSKVNGVPACQYTELYTTLRSDWNSSILVMTDWGAMESTAPSIMAGTDLEMPFAAYYGDLLYDQIYVTQNLSETYLDRAVGHLLAKYYQFGCLDNLSTNPVLETSELPQEVVDASAAIAYDIAVKSGTLLKNDYNTLPLTPGKSFGVFGPSGLQYTHGAGFAERSFGFPGREISTLSALQSKTSNFSIPSAVGVDLQGSIIPSQFLRSLNNTPGLTRSNSASTTYTVDSTVDFSGSSALPSGTVYTWNGTLIAPEDGYYRLSLQRDIYSPYGGYNNSDFSTIFNIGSLSVNNTDIATGYRLYLDGGARPWSTPIITTDGWDNIGNTVWLSAGVHNLVASITGIINQNVSVRLCWVTPSQREANIQAAVTLAGKVDTPLVFGYANSESQNPLALDDRLDELINRMAAANPKTVVVLNNADPITMPWLSSVSSVLWMGYPGQEGGRATADLLLGNANPQGKLPLTYPLSLNQSITRDPRFPGRVDTTSGNATFSEGLQIGYRWYVEQGMETLFPFGFGLSYTQFEYTNLAVAGTAVSFTVKNTGDVRGTAIPQLYIGPPNSAAQYKVQFASVALVGFEDVDLWPQEEITIEISIGNRQLSFWDVETRSWILAKGKREAYIGTSVADKVLSFTFDAD